MKKAIFALLFAASCCFAAVPLTPKGEWKAAGGEYTVSATSVKPSGRLEATFKAKPSTWYLLTWESRIEAGGAPPVMSLCLEDGRRRYLYREAGTEWTKQVGYWFSGAEGTPLSLIFFFEPGTTVRGGVRNLDIRELPAKALTENLFLDGDFEAGCSEWQRNSGQPDFAARRIASPGFLSGRYSLELTLFPDREAAIASGYQPVTPGKGAELRFWAKASEPAVLDAIINVWSPYAHGGKHAYKRQGFRIDGEWRQYTLRYEIPNDLSDYPDLADRLAKIQFFGEKRDGVKILLDDIEFFGALE